MDVSITTTDTYTQLWKFITGAVRAVSEGFLDWLEWDRRILISKLALRVAPAGKVSHNFAQKIPSLG